LVDGDSVESELVGVLELVEIAVVELDAPGGVEIAVGKRQRRRREALLEVRRQVRIRHQVEVGELHRARIPPSVDAVQETTDGVRNGLRLLEVKRVSAIGNRLEPGTGNQLRIAFSVRSRNDAVVLRPQ